MKNLKRNALLAAPAVLLSTASNAALDVTGMVTEIGAAGTNVETVAVAIFAVVGIMFAISKIRQLGKA